MNDRKPYDRERFPTLTDAGRRMLEQLREHPAAPIYRNRSGNRLLAHEVEALRAFEQTIPACTVGWPPGMLPEWVSGFVARTFAEVPFYRALGSPPQEFVDLPTVNRADLSADIARFVPDTAPLERMMHFSTSGTTGHPLLVPSHPLVAGRYLAFHKRALRRFGITLEHGRDQVGVVLLGFQKKCFTYVSVTPTMDESGLAKINLHPGDWRDPNDRARYLDALRAEVYAGDPISFAELLALPLTTAPRALISVSMALSHGLRRRLETRFGCPVLDVYSLNEVGPVAVFDESAGGHVLLQPELYVEILDDADRPVPPGERGEIVVTGGFNFCLPLLRYRTGDYGALRFGADAPVIVDLIGRRPVRFRNRNGVWFNNIDVTHALARVSLSRFRLHQDAKGALCLYLPQREHHLAGQCLSALAPLFGAGSVTVATLTAEDKTLQYSSELVGADL